MDKNLLMQRLNELATERGQTLTNIFVDSGVGKNFKSNLNYANPSIGKITMLANYLNVSTDYLLGKTDKKEKPVGNTDELSMTDREIVERIIALPPEKRTAVEAYLDFLLSQQAKDEEKQKRSHAVKIAARNGSFEEKEITDEQLEMIKNLPDVDDL